MNLNQMETPNYYAIIPANVRYDKELSASAKLLYAEITSLTHKDGYCWATNKYFAELYDVDERSVSRWISSLVERKYIISEIEDNYNRKIYILNKGGVTKMSEGCDKNVQEDRQKCLHNIKDNNKNNILGPSPSAPASDIQYVPLEEEIKSLRKKEVKSDPELTVKRDIIGFFIRKSKEYHNDYCPIINLPAALRLVNGCLDFSNPTEIKEWIEWYLQSDLYEILGSDIKTCLCTASYNKYKDYRRKHD